MASYRLGYCITAHGFGHAARAVAVMEALSKRISVKHKVVSLVPEWFFSQFFSDSLSVFSVQTDVGLVQLSALKEDLEASLVELQNFYPLAREKVDELATIFSDCDLVICDIAPSGIAAAKRAGVPSLLLENFTWDWVYKGYLSRYPQLKTYIDYLNDLYSKADYHVQAEPVCNNSRCDVRVEPVAREIKKSVKTVRQQLGIQENRQLVLMTMGGEGAGTLPLDSLARLRDILFVIAGTDPQKQGPENLYFLPTDSGIFHPDLVAACDAVIGKVGYSTLAEVYHADVPFGYISRPTFPESAPLVSYIEHNMTGLEISAGDFREGKWLHQLPELIAMKRQRIKRTNGADQCAEFILSVLRQRETGKA